MMVVARFARLMGLVFLISASTAQAAPDFSDQVVPFERISQLLWRFMPEVVPEFQRAYGFRNAPDGSAVLLGKSGREVYWMDVRSKVNSLRTSRFSEFSLRDRAGSEVFGIRVKNIGVDLAPIPIDKLRKGELPVFPTQGVRFTEVTSFAMEYLQTRIRIAVSGQRVGTPGPDAMEVWCSVGSDDIPFLHYREWQTEHSRQFVYDVLAKWNGMGTRGRIEARKIQTPDMLVGTEEFRINGREVGMNEFQTVLNASVISMAEDFRGSLDSFLRYFALMLQ